ncbi:hypothetical protein [Streptomyces sp. NPDC047014]|uniref:hypothetical protein n=1 Tax=Streptomyces sp. NPDC047014 TaxID=3155736 RepID=UPI0033D3122C
MIGLVAALSIPAGLAWYKKRPALAVLFASGYAAVVILPASRSQSAWLALVAVVILTVCITAFCRPWLAIFGDFHWLAAPTMSPTRYVAGVGSAASVALLLYVGEGSVQDSMKYLAVVDGRLLITVSGLLIAMFGCQLVIGPAVRPLLKEIEAEIASGNLPVNTNDFTKVGPHVGWIERFILFAFLVSGSPEAAALVVAAKSFARAPEARQGGKLVGDYYVIGTLVSVAAALFSASATRIILGLSPL